MRIPKIVWWLGLAALVAAAVWYFFFFSSSAPKAKYFSTKLTRGDVHQTVEATGQINAVTTVQVGSQVSGTISQLFADFNTKVHKGQVVAQIDPALFRANLLQSQADLANAKANLASAKANLVKAQAANVQSQADYTRNVSLAKEGVFSQQQLDLAKANADSATASVTAAEAQVTQAVAQVQQKDAAVALTQTNLNYTTIHTPIDGTVINRNVDVGQTVAASLQAPTLFTVAQDLTKMQVWVSTDESDVGSIQIGQAATFHVDAFPKQTFNGKVSQVRMNATTVQNVVTYTTIGDFDNPEGRLFPGMTAYVSIPAADALNVLRVPNGALRYKPDMKPEEIRALYAKYGVARSGNGNANGNGATTQASTEQAAGQASKVQGAASGTPSAAGAERHGAHMGMAGAPAAAGSNTSTTPKLDEAIVWKLGPKQELIPVRLRIGITDHTLTEVKAVLGGELNEGDDLVTGSIAAAKGAVNPVGATGPRR